MNKLKSYTDVNEAFNRALFNGLDAGRPGGLTQDLYLGNEPTLDLTTGNLTLVSQQQYPYTALGRIGLRKLFDPPQNSIVQQIVNRHSVTQDNKSAAQLVLLDTTGVDQVIQALKRDAKHTAGSTAAHPFFDSTDPHVQWILNHRQETINAITDAQKHRRYPTGTAHTHLRALWGYGEEVQQAFRDWLYTGNRGGWDRFKKHDDRSGDRLKSHYSNLTYGLSSKQSITAARGEYAATKLLITAYGSDYQLKRGKSPNGKRPNGIDQIWVKRDKRTGKVLEYLIIEAKGSYNAHLEHPKTGQQMSARWLFYCLIKMAKGSKAYTDQYPDEDKTKSLPTKILDALINNDGVPVKGIVFHSLYGSYSESKVVQMIDLGRYDFAPAYALASSQTKAFTNASSQPFLAFQ